MMVRSAPNRLAWLVGFLLVSNLGTSLSLASEGAPCVANADCDSNYCDWNQKRCDWPTDEGAGETPARALQANANATATNLPSGGNSSLPPATEGNDTATTTPTPVGNATMTAPPTTSSGGPNVTAGNQTNTDGEDDATPMPDSNNDTTTNNGTWDIPAGNETTGGNDAGGGMMGNGTHGNIFGHGGGGNGTSPPAPVGTGNVTTSTAGAVCRTDVNCGAGFFCSISGVCTKLTCANWANSTPAGNVTYSEAPCTAEGAEAGTAFCGTNGNCYTYDCINWYTYGPVAFTGYDPNSPVALVCDDYGDGFLENMNSVTFGCRSWEPGKKAPERISWTHFFNTKCTAKPRGSDDFTCYHNKPGTDYTEFQAEVARLSPPSCDPETFENELPLYWYIIQLWQDRKGNVTKYKSGRENTLGGDSFNPNLAEKTMYAVLTSQDDVPEQTIPDDGTAGGLPSEGQSGAASHIFSTSTCFVVMAACLALL